jgi:hypothetical protein
MLRDSIKKDLIKAEPINRIERLIKLALLGDGNKLKCQSMMSLSRKTKTPYKFINKKVKVMIQRCKSEMQ